MSTHGFERLAVEQAFGLGRQGCGDYHVIRQRQLLKQVVVAVNGDKVGVVMPGPAGDAVGFHANGADQASDLATDGTGAHNKHLIALGTLCVPMLPLVVHLQANGAGEVLGEHQNGAEHIFRDGSVKNAPGVGDRDTAVDQRRKHQRIDAGAGSVYPLEFISCRPCGFEGFSAKVRDHHYIGAGQGIPQGRLVTGKPYSGPGPKSIHSGRFLLVRGSQNGYNRFAVFCHLSSTHLNTLFWGELERLVRSYDPTLYSLVRGWRTVNLRC